MNTIFTSYKETKDENESYEGAFVFEPIPGVYKDGVMVVDYNSLYPSSIMMCNLSPETYVGKISFQLETRLSLKIIDLKTCTAEKFYPYGKRNSKRSYQEKNWINLKKKMYIQGILFS